MSLNNETILSDLFDISSILSLNDDILELNISLSSLSNSLISSICCSSFCFNVLCFLSSSFCFNSSALLSCFSNCFWYSFLFWLWSSDNVPSSINFWEKFSIPFLISSFSVEFIVAKNCLSSDFNLICNDFCPYSSICDNKSFASDFLTSACFFKASNSANLIFESNSICFNLSSNSFNLDLIFKYVNSFSTNELFKILNCLNNAKWNLSFNVFCKSKAFSFSLANFSCACIHSRFLFSAFALISLNFLDKSLLNALRSVSDKSL